MANRKKRRNDMSNYEIIRKAKAQIEARRSAAIADAESRNEHLRLLSDEIKDIDTELSGTGMLIFKTACAGGDITPIKERNKALQTRRKQIIVSLGYPESYGDTVYSCSLCNDTGYKDNGLRTCSCLKEMIIKERIAASAMGNLIHRQSFDNFDLEVYAYDKSVYEKMKTNLAVAKGYVANFGKNAENLLLIGKTGTGKTHISTAIAREMIHKGYDVIYDSAQNIISDFEDDRFRSGYGNYESRSEKYLDCSLLIIDDLGTEFTNQFTVSTLYNLLNSRQNRGLSTVISTNLSPDELAAKYEDRIYSRIIGRGCRVLVFDGKDRRLEF